MSLSTAEIESINKDMDEYLSLHAAADAASLAGVDICDFKGPVMYVLQTVIHVVLSKVPLIPTQKIEAKLIAGAKSYLDKKCPE